MKRYGELFIGLSLLVFMIGLVLSPVVHADRTAAGMTCSKSKVYDTNTNGATLLQAAGAAIYVCGYTFWSNVAGPTNVDLRFGTQVTNPCDTGATKLTPSYPLIAAAGPQDTSPLFRGLYVPPNNQLCINTSAGNAVQAVVYFETVQ